MDNTGLYCTFEDVVVELYEGGVTTVGTSAITLASKTTDAGGDTYEYSAGTPQLNDVLYQSGEYDRIIEILTGPARVRVVKTGADNSIANGPATLLRSSAPALNKRRTEGLIKQAMEQIDRSTRQFFNKRTGVFKLEGNNTPLLHLQVPIIEITKLVVNSGAQELFEGELQDFVAFKGRQSPQDDRWNPKINLNVGRGRDSIYSRPLSNRVFVKGTLTEITGSFGFLEPDGSTPSLIQLATKALVIDQINNPIADTDTAETGPLRRLKVDLHEKEFFDPRSGSSSSLKSSETGNARVDRILAKYRSPILVSGSFSILPGTYSQEWS